MDNRTEATVGDARRRLRKVDVTNANEEEKNNKHANPQNLNI